MPMGDVCVHLPLDTFHPKRLQCVRTYLPMYIPCFPLAASNKLSHNQLEAGLKLFSHVEQWHGRVRITYLLTVASSLQATCTEG